MKLRTLFLFTSLLALVACGGSEEPAEPADFEVRDNTQEVQDYYASKPDFFSFKTLADLPTNLSWQDGSHLPDIGSPDAKKGGTQYFRLQDFPRTLRLVGPDANGNFRRYLLDDVQVRLGHRHPEEFEFYPGLAEAWAVDKDSKTVFVKLDANARFSDGHPVTADDFFFMFFMYQSSYIIAPWYNNWFGTQFTNITKYDDLTFSVTVPEAKPDMDKRVLDFVPMPEHFFTELGDDYVDRYQWRFWPSTGAYQIKDEDIKKGRSIVFSRMDDWWAKDKKFFRNRYNPDRLHFSVIRDTDKAFEAFKRGDIDQAGLNLAEFWYEKLPDSDPAVQNGYIQKSVFFNQHPRPTYGIWINTSKPLLDDLNIRLGIQHAANFDLVVEKYFRGDWVRMQTSSDGYGEFSHPTLKSRPFDVAKAAEYFAEAGFSERGPDGILVNEQGQRLSFTLSSGYAALQDAFTILKEEAQKAGLELRIEVLDQTAGFKKVQEKKHDVHFVAFSVSLEMYPRFWETYHSDNAYEPSAFINGCDINPDRTIKTQTNNLELMDICEMDELINRYRASDDKQEMIELAHTMTQMHHDYASFVPAFYQPSWRLGHWRWIRFPDFFAHKHASYWDHHFIHWIDEGIKAETLAAEQEGQALSTEINVYDQHANQ